MEGEQLDGKKKVRNDRLIAVAGLSHAYKDWKKLKDLPDHFITELVAFFVNYHGVEGKKYKCWSARKPKQRWTWSKNPRKPPPAPNEMTRRRQLLRASDSPAELYSCRLAGQVFGW